MMKRTLMQIFRTVVTVAVVGTMAAMIFELRHELKAVRDRQSAASAQPGALETIFSRTSVRSYTDEPVSAEDIEILERAAMAAPTAVNKQPWRIIAITDRNVLRQIPAAHPFAAHAAKAPLAFVICGVDNGLGGVGREFWIQDCSAASENLLLAARARGLGAVWCGVYPLTERVDAIRKLLGIPEDVTPLNVIVVGHPMGPQQPKDKWDPAKVHVNRW